MEENEIKIEENPQEQKIKTEEEKTKARKTHIKDIKLEVNELSPEIKKSFKIRTITALLLAVSVVPLLILGDWFYVGLAFVFSIIGCYEFINVLSNKKFPLIVDIFTFIMTMSFIFWAPLKQLLSQNFSQDAAVFYDSSKGYFYMSDIFISTLGVAVMILCLFLFALSYSKFDVTDVCYLTTMSILFALCVQAVTLLRFCPESSIAQIDGSTNFVYEHHIESSLLVVYVALGAFMSDIGAYVFGVLFGKHKMNPRISPKKTWEGFVGGILFSFIITFSFAMICDALNTPILYGILDKKHWWYILLLSLTMPPISVLGDLLFSTVKRYYKIKDFGRIFPGHGGLLDRIDSLLVTSLFVALFILVVRYFPFVS